MFAVVRTGGKQYRVHPGDKIVVEKLDGNAGDKVTLGDVLLAGDGGSLKSTQGLTVAAEIVAQAKGEKVTVFKKRRRHNYRRKKGHRQQHTILKIVAIGDAKAPKPVPSKTKGPGKGNDPATQAPKDERSAAALAKTKAKTENAEQKSENVEGKPTENPAPEQDTQANPPVKGDAEVTPTDAARAKKATAGGKSAKPASTKNAAPAKAAAKKRPKAK
jgi:large subunit ribosomal protein L21